MPAREVVRVTIIVPSGTGGLVGFALGAAGQPFIPYEPGAFIVSNGEIIDWPLEGQITSGAWQLFAFNTGKFAHTLEIRFLTDLPSAQAPAPQALIPVGAITPGGDAVPTLPPAPPFPVLPPPPPLPPEPVFPTLPAPPPEPVLPPPGGPPSAPAGAVYHVTAQLGLHVRSGPGSAYRSLALLPYRTPVTIVCQAWGERVNNSRVWDRISAPTAGYVSDWWIDTPVTGGFSPGLAVCP
jgi:hypothetical protein